MTLGICSKLGFNPTHSWGEATSIIENNEDILILGAPLQAKEPEVVRKRPIQVSFQWTG